MLHYSSVIRASFSRLEKCPGNESLVFGIKLIGPSESFEEFSLFPQPYGWKVDEIDKRTFWVFLHIDSTSLRILLTIPVRSFF